MYFLYEFVGAALAATVHKFLGNGLKMVKAVCSGLSAMQDMGYEAPAGRPPGSRLNPALQFSGHRRPRSSVPQSAKDASQRRRDILGLLVLCLMATLAGWFVSHQTAVLITHLVFDVALVGFVLLVLQRRQLEAERMAKVHYLHAAADSEIAGIARRSAN